MRETLKVVGILTSVSDVLSSRWSGQSFMSSSLIASIVSGTQIVFILLVSYWRGLRHCKLRGQAEMNAYLWVQ